MKLRFSKIFLIVFVIFGFFLASKTVFAVPPSCDESGFCMFDGQICPGGEIKPDSSCTGKFNGNACCVKTPLKDIACGGVADPTKKDQYNCTCESGWVNFSNDGNPYACCGWVLNVKE